MEYDIAVIFTKRSEDYVCRTVRSIIHRARYTRLYLSFSGTRGEDLERMHASCPEIKALPTAVFSENQASAIREIIDVAGPVLDAVGKIHVDIFQSVEGPTSLAMNPASKIIPQWFTIRNALQMVPEGTGRHLIVMEDDVVLAEDFDELLRSAVAEATLELRDDDFAISLYVGDSQTVQVTEDGTMKAMHRMDIDEARRRRGKSTDPRWDALKMGPGPLDIIIDEYDDARARGVPPILAEDYVWGHQAVLYSAGVIDDFRDSFRSCERDTVALMERIQAGKVTRSMYTNPAGPRYFGVTLEKPCMQAADIYSPSFIQNRDEYTPFYTTKDSLVQHIGVSSTIQNTESGKLNQLFHYNVELGNVSEDYDNDSTSQAYEHGACVGCPRDRSTSVAPLGERSVSSTSMDGVHRSPFLPKTEKDIEYDITVGFAKRDSEQYICRTVRSIQHRARYTNLYLSFSGMEGPELEQLRDECPELRGVPTAVYSEEQVRRVREIIDYVGPIMDMLELNMMHTSDGPTTVKMNPARGIVPQVRWRDHFPPSSIESSLSSSNRRVTPPAILSE